MRRFTLPEWIYPIVIFLGSMLVRFYVLYKSYFEFSLVLIINAKLDLAHHFWFFRDLVRGNPFYMEQYHDIYSPTSSFVILLLTFPLLLTPLNYFYITVIGFLLIMAINSLGMYYLLKRLSMSRNSSLMFAIFNPFEIIGIVMWGGVSLALTETAITWIIYFSQRYKSGEMTKKKAYIIIFILIIISATAHRTGLVIHLTFFMIKLIDEYRDNDLDKLKVMYSFVLTVSLSWILLARGGLIIYYYNDLSNALAYRRENTWSYILENLVYILIIFINYSLRIIDRRYLSVGEKNDYPSMSSVGQYYVLTGIILFLVPLADYDISGRFLMAINFYWNFLLAYPLYILKKYPDRLLMKNLRKIYYLLMYILLFATFVFVIQLTYFYVRALIYVIDDFS